MNRHSFFRFITVDPINLSVKGRLLAVVSSFIAILAVAWVTRQSGIDSVYPIIVASMGASAVIVFITPGSPLAQPWPLIGGHLVSAVIGITCARLFSDTTFAAAFAAGGSIFAMLLLRCLHPPGAATALMPVIAGTSMNYSFVLMPVAINVAIMLAMATVINRWILRHEYPMAPSAERKKHQHNTASRSSPLAGISEQDLEHALENMDRFMDVSAGDLSQLLAQAQMQRFKRHSGHITCADIMVKNILTVEYGTDVEDAWKIMHHEHLKAMPVIDRARRVIGIITWNDFFKFIDADANESFREKFRSFIRRTPDVSTDKPESVGHVMTSPVGVLPESASIAELIPLMSSRGYRQIPIINGENRLVGMIYQANLIAALHGESHDKVKNPPLGV